MAFCPYCGKQTADGEICACTTVNTQQTNTGAAVSYASFSGSTPPPPPRPADPVPPPVSEAPVSDNRPVTPPGAAPQSGYAPQSSFGSADRDAFTAPQNANVPTADFAPQSGCAPQSSFGVAKDTADFDEFAEVPTAYAPPPPPPPAKTSAFVQILECLLERTKKLVSAKANEAVDDAMNAADLSWSVVFGAYVVFGSLACSFAVPGVLRIPTGELFGGLVWRSLLVNIFTVALAIAAVMGVCASAKKKLSLSRTLNLAGLAFVPAAALNVLGLIFSFFFPAGTLICGVLSAVCTIVILFTGLDSHCGKRILWSNVLTVSLMVLIYILMVYLASDALLTGQIAKLHQIRLG